MIDLTWFFSCFIKNEMSSFDIKISQTYFRGVCLKERLCVQSLVGANPPKMRFFLSEFVLAAVISVSAETLSDPVSRVVPPLLALALTERVAILFPAALGGGTFLQDTPECGGKCGQRRKRVLTRRGRN